MRQETEEETFEIMNNCFLSLEKIGVRSSYTRQYLESMRSMLALQRALSVVNHKGCGCHSQGILEVEDLEATLAAVKFSFKHPPKV